MQQLRETSSLSEDLLKEVSIGAGLVSRILLDFTCEVGATEDWVGSTLVGIRASVSVEPLKEPRLYTLVACQLIPLDLLGA